MEETTTNAFLLTMPAHIIFCVLAFVILIIRFARYKKPYQLLFAITIPVTLLLRLEDTLDDKTGKMLYSAVGVFEVITFIIGMILIIIDVISYMKKNKKGNNPKAEELEIKTDE